MNKINSRFGKRGRLYIDITNSCNLSCPLCCGNSSSMNTKFMSLELFKTIIENDLHEEVEVQIEGGEPTINPELWKILSYCNNASKVKKITLLHNCTKIDECIEYFNKTEFCKIVEFKLSLNFYLLSIMPDLIARIENAHNKLKNNLFVKVHVNARYREDNNDDNNMIKSIFLSSIPASRIFVCDFCNYGRAKTFEEPCSEWLGYASDGTFFGADTDARFKYEKELH